jgi:hypothetical protein
MPCLQRVVIKTCPEFISKQDRKSSPNLDQLHIKQDGNTLSEIKQNDNKLKQRRGWDISCGMVQTGRSELLEGRQGPGWHDDILNNSLNTKRGSSIRPRTQ